MIIENEIIIYTDGSSKEHPRRGGIGIRFIFPNYSTGEETYEDHSMGSFVGATSQQMELYACIVALEKCLEFEDLSKLSKIIFRVDSNYVRTNVDNAKYRWPKNNWLTIEGAPVENVEHWQHLVKLLSKFRALIKFEKVKAHGKGKKNDIHNERANDLAIQGSDCPISIPFNIKDVRRKHSEHKTKKGCVQIADEPINIRIIECTPYKMHKDIFKFRYVVTSQDNSNYKLSDFIYYNKRLLEGHTYRVIMEKRGRLVYIKQIIEELTINSRFKLLKFSTE